MKSFKEKMFGMKFIRLQRENNTRVILEKKYMNYFNNQF